jgi:hypothetical protein
MKKLLFGLLLLSSATFGQKLSYKIGLMTSVPAEVNASKETIAIGSTFMEVSKKLSEKIIATGNVGYIKFNADTKFALIPVMLGVRYPLNESLNFGVSGGVGVYNTKAVGTQNFMFSPFIGATVKRLSIDARYISVVDKNNPIKTLALVFGFSL